MLEVFSSRLISICILPECTRQGTIVEGFFLVGMNCQNYLFLLMGVGSFLLLLYIHLHTPRVYQAGCHCWGIFSFFLRPPGGREGYLPVVGGRLILLDLRLKNNGCLLLPKRGAEDSLERLFDLVHWISLEMPKIGFSSCHMVDKYFFFHAYGSWISSFMRTLFLISSCIYTIRSELNSLWSSLNSSNATFEPWELRSVQWGANFSWPAH